MTRRLLILGGTAEAVALAEAAHARFGAPLAVTSALAGRTRSPRLPPGEVRRGGFGGAGGLRRYLEARRIAALIDATHPFAATISRHAGEACAAAGVPYLALVRPPWSPAPGDRWRFVADEAAAAEAVRASGARRVFLTIGGRRLAPFAALVGVHFLVRMIEPPPAPPPLADHRIILARGPFAPDAERRLMAAERIHLLITRASGGAASEAKLQAARALGLPVVLIERPPAPGGEAVASVEQALDWLAARLGL
jgi:precorrin-6A/cobalt-precorrin-6A reductase